MPKATTPSFILELPLKMGSKNERQILHRFEIKRRLYNAVLGELLIRLKRRNTQSAWFEALKIENLTQRRDALKAINKEYGFTENDAQKYLLSICQNNGFKGVLGSMEVQVIASNVFKTVNKRSMGKCGAPRFKGKNSVSSLENKSNTTGLRFRKESGLVTWTGVVFPVFHKRDGTSSYIQEALENETKYCRILYRNIKGKRRWFLQLIQKGLAPQKYRVANGEVGLDVGPQTIAIVSDTTMSLEKFAPSVEQPWAKQRILQRTLDRSRRATNPHCFKEDGTWIKGAKITVRSKKYQETRQKNQEIERVLRERRKRDHGNLVNRVLSHGNVIKSEKLSYIAWQKNFGRSVKVRAPASFLNKLRYKAEKAGGEWIDLRTQKLKLSQLDHCTQTYQKKPLKQRWHTLGDGSGLVQRDVYSALLALHSEDNVVHCSKVGDYLASAQAFLELSPWTRKETANVSSLLAHGFMLATPERIGN